ncbi:alpha/beta hydrolase fold protein [Kalymmatonema gypsitolerans NIES-4073]|nr:alpha/beta hydrolase fold protein [Scytonema sp. NIES-4073]
MIAGFMCDHIYWSLLMRSVVKQYQVIRLDNPGIRQSSAFNWLQQGVPHHTYSLVREEGALLSLGTGDWLKSGNAPDLVSVNISPDIILRLPYHYPNPTVSNPQSPLVALIPLI